MAQAIKVLVVDDHPVVREGLAAMLGRLPGIAVVGEAPDGQQALEMAGRLAPDVVLMDMRMPVMDGVEATRRIVRDHPAVKVLVLTTFDQDEMILAGLRAGARGYLLKDSPREEIARAIADVHQGKVILHPLVAARVVQHVTAADAPPPRGEAPQVTAEGPLSEREMDVLRCLSLGLANKEIAQRLKIAESTVKTHLANIFSKLGVSDRTEAVTAAIRRGWIALR
ncbi:MAG TPA: response regulator transcription factor [Symbiobacteriaceae bacterium]|nr:response regulator transcription factor [Symbiobacteriaceae bacterium]